MQNKLRVGIVGLGGIAQKAYLPILTKETDWELAGAYTPNKQKRERICHEYRMNSFDSLSAIGKSCDAVFVHTSTNSHAEVVAYLLENGTDVYVDKPLAANGDEAQRLADLSEKKQRKLMVGFNRRFAPMYVKAKKLAGAFDAVQMEKHRPHDVGPDNFGITMLDDYLHVIDTLRWLGGGEMDVTNHFSKLNNENQMIFAHHSFLNTHQLLTASMHREAGTGLEKLEFISKYSIIRVLNMHTLQMESNQQLSTETPGSWENILETKGFKDCILHFIDAVKRDKQPAVNGWEAVQSQLLVESLIRNMTNKT